MKIILANPDLPREARSSPFLLNLAAPLFILKLNKCMGPSRFELEIFAILTIEKPFRIFLDSEEPQFPQALENHCVICYGFLRMSRRRPNQLDHEPIAFDCAAIKRNGKTGSKGFRRAAKRQRFALFDCIQIYRATLEHLNIQILIYFSLIIRPCNPSAHALFQLPEISHRQSQTPDFHKNPKPRPGHCPIFAHHRVFWPLQLASAL